jgi:hypothetical protein
LVLWRLLVAAANPAYGHVSHGVQLMRQAARIAINRTVAGVHFPADSAAGAVLGLTLGQYLVNRANGTATNYRAAEFDGAAYPGGEDFDWSDLFNVTAAPPRVDFTKAYVNDMGLPLQALDQSGPLVWLWNKAVAEWA